MNNELGRLCTSFEEMRIALYDNNLKLWRTIEERRTMQASVAHDLRNPLAIMAGIVEQLRESVAAGKLTDEKLSTSLANLASTTSRMENYTNYIRDLDAIEDTEVNIAEVALPDFLREAAGGVGVLAEAKGLEITTSCDVPVCKVGLDKEIFYRVLENVFSNAVRYAKSHIKLEFALRKGSLWVRVSDDGPGFSKELLKKKQSLYYSEDPTGEHMGLGLATSRILCAKHGGALRLSNTPNCGASVEITFAVK